MTIYTSLALVNGVVLGIVIGFLIFRTMNKRRLKKAKVGGVEINTLKSEGVDLPKKGTELPMEGKDVVLEQSAVSSDVVEIDPDEELIRLEAEEKIEKLRAAKIEAAKSEEYTLEELKKMKSVVMKQIKKETDKLLKKKK